MKKQDNVITGIYKIINPKGKVYIGQSVNINRRKNSYKNFKIKEQPRIYNSLKKYGWENHIFNIIEECPIEQLNERETYWKQYYLNQFGDDWNMVLFCNLHDSGGGPLSKETRNKIGNANRGRKYTQESCDNISKRLKGRIYSKETLDKMSQPRSKEAKENMRYSKTKEHALNISKSNKGKPQPPGFIDKLKESNKKHYEKDSNRNKKISQSNKKSIFQYDKNMTLIKEWNSIMEACFYLNGHYNDSGIGLTCQGKRKSAYNFFWEYK
jgi:group I intron endonuclease